VNLPLTLSQSVQIDAAPRPVAYWAELWGRTPGTVIRWIQEGTCPARKIGGVYMISVLDLLNWEPDGETSGGPRGELRDATEREGSAREDARPPEDGWPCPKDEARGGKRVGGKVGRKAQGKA